MLILLSSNILSHYLSYARRLIEEEIVKMQKEFTIYALQFNELRNFLYFVSLKSSQTYH